MILYVPLILVPGYDLSLLTLGYCYHAFGHVWNVFVMFEDRAVAEAIKKELELKVLIIRFPENGPYSLKTAHTIEGFL